ncbi:MAG: tetratricopeptide repeat protein [Candidatus Aminicenantales bacterium]
MMKKQSRFLFAFSLCALGLLFLTSGLSSQQTAAELFEKALYVEEGQGDLQKAIGLYQDIVKRFPGERETAAKAQLHIGLCYEKLGLGEAQKAFQEVVENYPDQSAAVKVARQKLSVLTRAREIVNKGAGEFGIRKIGRFDGQAVSPDGRWLAYVDWESRADAAVMDIATGKKRRLTNVDKGLIEMIVFSPDSKRIAFGWLKYNAPYQVGIINCDGSGQRFIYEAGRDESFWPVGWAPDGKSIVGLLEKTAAPSFLAVLRVADGSVRSVKQIGMSYEGIAGADFSPDGRWIAYDRSPSAAPRESRDIFLLEAEGDKEVPLIKHPADDRLLGWSPCGKWILFSSDRSGSWDAWLLPVEDGQSKGEPILVKHDFGGPGRPGGRVGPIGFTQTGSFYYSQGRWEEDVFVAEFDLDKPDSQISPRKVSLRFEGANCYSDWSPDGRYLAYRSIRKPAGPKSFALCILSADTGEQREIFPELTGFSQLSWHPDGKSVVVIGYGMDSRAGLYRVDTKTGEASFIVEGGESRPTGFAPRFSPDGNRVYYAIDLRDQDECQILMYDLQTKQKKEIYRGLIQINRMDISPDGKYLAFWEIGKGGSLKIIPTAGGTPTVLDAMNKAEEGINGITWSPDGKYVFYSKFGKDAGKTGSCELWRIPAQGGTPVKYNLTVKGMESLSISLDGKKLAFNSWEVSTEVWVMENFLPKAK